MVDMAMVVSTSKVVVVVGSIPQEDLVHPHNHKEER